METNVKLNGSDWVNVTAKDETLRNAINEWLDGYDSLAARDMITTMYRLSIARGAGVSKTLKITLNDMMKYRFGAAEMTIRMDHIYASDPELWEFTQA